MMKNILYVFFFLFFRLLSIYFLFKLYYFYFRFVRLFKFFSFVLSVFLCYFRSNNKQQKLNQKRIQINFSFFFSHFLVSLEYNENLLFFWKGVNNILKYKYIFLFWPQQKNNQIQEKKKKKKKTQVKNKTTTVY